MADKTTSLPEFYELINGDLEKELEDVGFEFIKFCTSIFSFKSREFMLNKN